MIVTMTRQGRPWLWVLALAGLNACASDPPLRPAPVPPPAQEIHRAPAERPGIPGGDPNFGDVIEESVRRKRLLDTIDSIRGRRAI